MIDNFFVININMLNLISYRSFEHNLWFLGLFFRQGEPPSSASSFTSTHSMTHGTTGQPIYHSGDK